MLALLLPFLSTLHAKTLESQSPFLPPGHGKSQATTPPPPPPVNGPLTREIEFRGIVQLAGVYEFSIFHRSKQKSYWLRANESKDGIQIRGFDVNSRTITITMGGRTERLSLMSASETPLPVATSTNLPGAANQTPGLPPEVENLTTRSGNQNDETPRNRVVPRRRVILPQN